MEKTNQDIDNIKTTNDLQEIEENDLMFASKNTYLSSGICIGMNRKLKIMMPFIYNIRKDGLCFFNLKKIESRIDLCIKILSRYNPNEILSVSMKKNGYKAVSMFGKTTGAKAIYGRFMPGMLSNPRYVDYFEPKIVIACDPYGDKQVLEEAYKINIPVICLCDTYNFPRLVDLVVPMNNKGRKSIALFFYILSKEFLKSKKIINQDSDFKYKPDDFEMTIE
ncbi:MAG: 30S ribosomal protein S2 [Candidatus Aenigmarchaeota archaeon ex4484_52]|nr:MAG: 30S ribosomal protein S2 [Candidatus Aenigmarchaeota archaeon ex4484_52]